MKPDDIPQDVWEAAENAVYRFCNKHHLWGDLGFDRAGDLHETIARAIMAAKAEAEAERDMLQEILDGRPAINAALPDSYIRWSQAIYSGDFAREVIRNRGATK